MIRRHLGSQQPVVPDFRLRLSSAETDSRAQANQGMRLAPGDIVLLCSDGLTDLVRDDEIGTTLSRFSLSDALQDLVDQANARGGHDNISIVAVYVPSPRPNTGAPHQEKDDAGFGWVARLIGIDDCRAQCIPVLALVRPHPTPTPILVSSQAPLVVPTLIPTGYSIAGQSFDRNPGRGDGNLMTSGTRPLPENRFPARQPKLSPAGQPPVGALFP